MLSAHRESRRVGGERTSETLAGPLGASREIRRRLLNHAPEGVEDVYDQHDYLAELAGYLERWGEAVVSASVMRADR